MRIARFSPPLRTMLLASALLGVVASPAHGSELSPPLPTADFRHDVTEGPQPSTPKPFDAHDDRFMFAVFSDLAGVTMQETWEGRYGPRYYHFVYKDVLFLVVDTEDHAPERTREIERLRAEALERVKADGWAATAEAEYSRIAEYAAGTISAAQSEYFRAAIEAALADRPYTVFHGHEHAYRYLQRQGRDYLGLATTGGVQFPRKVRSMDHVTLVTVGDDGVDIANLLLSGILDRTGHVPRGSDEVCFEAARCGEAD